MAQPVAKITGLRRPVRSLPILTRDSKHGDWLEFWVNCPERGAIGLEQCVHCRSALEITAVDPECRSFALRCQSLMDD
jgi:hypothetical protein